MVSPLRQPLMRNPRKHPALLHRPENRNRFSEKHDASIQKGEASFGVQQDARRFKHFAEHIPLETQQCKTAGQREARESPIQPDCDLPKPLYCAGVGRICRRLEKADA
ncbi:hypothetical protein [Agrobacterium cavarae]|uniref:hypothetical protein n=1 Tax=Agrobacterium cavarae TaxID=2528239 RepID=UPI0028B0B4C0|nr:hypothetical protein [Agrobacterium cavarae]